MSSTESSSLPAWKFLFLTKAQKDATKAGGCTASACDACDKGGMAYQIACDDRGIAHPIASEAKHQLNYGWLCPGCIDNAPETLFDAVAKAVEGRRQTVVKEEFDLYVYNKIRISIPIWTSELCPHGLDSDHVEKHVEKYRDKIADCETTLAKKQKELAQLEALLKTIGGTSSLTDTINAQEGKRKRISDKGKGPKKPSASGAKPTRASRRHRAKQPVDTGTE
jgi:hypothetical protein